MIIEITEKRQCVDGISIREAFPDRSVDSITIGELRRLVEDRRAQAVQSIAEPERRRHDGVVNIGITDERVTAAYQKDEDFIELVKSLRYRWAPKEKVWYLEIGLRTGTARERAAELGNRLLNAGFSVRMPNKEVLEDAAEGRYEPMTRRWIAAYGGKDFSITWDDGKLYKQARKIPGARDRWPRVLVPGQEYRSVLDFAEAYDYQLTPGAQELVRVMQAALLLVDPAAAREPEYHERPVDGVLQSSREILDDLRD